MKLHKTEQDVALSQEAIKMSEPLVGTGVTVVFGGSKGPFRITVDYLERDQLVPLVETILTALGEGAKLAGVHQETIQTQSSLIARLRKSIDELRKQNSSYITERDTYASTALVGLSMFVETPLQGYVKDGGVYQMADDFKRAKKKMNSIQEAHDRVNKANVGLLNQLIDYDTAARELLAHTANVTGGLATVVENDLDALRDVCMKNQTVRLAPDATGKPEQQASQAARRVPWCGRCECYHYYGNCV